MDGELAVDALSVELPVATWSEWTLLVTAAATAPATLGVNLARRGVSGELLYVGHAGERAASQSGLRGRLGVYARGRGAVSGLGEATLDRALGDVTFVRDRLAALEGGKPARAKNWARAAIEWADVHVCWSPTAAKAAAMELDSFLLVALADHEL